MLSSSNCATLHRLAAGATRRSIFGLALLAAVAVLAPPTFAQAPAGPDAQAVAARLRQAFPGMPANARVEATVVPGIFAMRVPGFSGCPMYTDTRVTMIANNGKRGWATVPGGQPLAEASSRQLMASIYQALPQELIPVGGGDPSGMVLISGVDCQPSAQMEASLASQGASYRILPAALEAANLGDARSAACATDIRAAWKAIRHGRPDSEAKARTACQVDIAAVRDISCMVMGGRLPSALFHDGRYSQHPSEIAGLLAAR